MNIKYKINNKITAEQFINLLKQSTLSERRPIDNTECMQGMINNSNLVVSAWHNEKLVGLARSITDFHYACYLSDLAVDTQYQRTGIGKKLQMMTQEQLGSECKLILIAAPMADSYYEHIGFTKNDRCWVLERNKVISIDTLKK